MTEQPKRARIMQKGIDLTTGDRNASYGSPHPNLQTFAHLVNVYLKGLGWEGPKLDSVDGSMIMVLAKTSRVCVNKQHEDNYVDGATYFAIAGECADELLTKCEKTGPERFYAVHVDKEIVDAAWPTSNVGCSNCADTYNPSRTEQMKCVACGKIYPPQGL